MLCHQLHNLVTYETFRTLSCWTWIYPAFVNSVDPDQLASEEANWSRSALFSIKYANLQEQSGSSYWLAEPASVAQLDAPSDWRPGGRGFNPRRGRQHSFMEIDHEIFSMVILSLPLIQEGQLSVSGERMCSILVNRLED